eukprot:CAMPEP_0204607570 /NCGR_PEP_ID=MMETSP0661-20131031/59793_1 /ASSEMBLY_ACC=CAM_ASM_000606 /TAXON_ID=109239 /ORGANISM="Alexandrium margalefi, Strain AMGDE01CS-322" /LENGTH=276 /DNA_ID=CAMNT_0051618993 /DNA_START=60 /DNA_END=886 /DNA_ORIENTATION=-
MTRALAALLLLGGLLSPCASSDASSTAACPGGGGGSKVQASSLAQASMRMRKLSPQAGAARSAKGEEGGAEEVAWTGQRLEEPAPARPGSLEVRTNEQLETVALARLSRADALSIAYLPTGGLVDAARRMTTVELALAVVHLDVPGDFVECGVYTGGTAVLMLKVLDRVSSSPRRRAFWGADSFKGLPAKESSMESAQEDYTMTNVEGSEVGQAGMYTAAREEFEGNLKRWGVWNGSAAPVHVLEGWFNETLPAAPIGPISFLRLDGDMYVSTLDP